MRIKPFELERWQSVWENRVELNISESGVHPMTLAELAGDPETLQRLAGVSFGYPQTNGSEELRSRIAAQYPGAGTGHVLVTNGGSEANFVACWALLEPGDEVVLMQPNYMQIGGVAEAFGAVVKPWWLREANGWAPDVDELRSLLTPKTKLVAICNPNNPTGAVMREEAIRDICAAVRPTGAAILADEIYRGAEFDGVMTPTFWGQYERLVCTAGMSKAYGLPGLRMGWAVAEPKLAEKLWGYRDYTSIASSLLSDLLATLALEPARYARIIERTRSIIRRNYPAVQEWVQRNGGRLRHARPAAGAIAWVGYSGGRRSAELAETLRSRRGVLLVPGTQFEMEGYLRVGFGGDAAQLTEALRRVDAEFSTGERAAAAT